MPQALQTLHLTCLAWFMPLHALDATTGPRHPAEAAELSSAAETAWLAGDWLIDTRAPAAWVVPGVELAELQRSTASAARRTSRCFPRLRGPDEAAPLLPGGPEGARFTTANAFGLQLLDGVAS